VSREPDSGAWLWLLAALLALALLVSVASQPAGALMAAMLLASHR